MYGYARLKRQENDGGTQLDCLHTLSSIEQTYKVKCLDNVWICSLILSLILRASPSIEHTSLR